jgi:hypothetical protein
MGFHSFLEKNIDIDLHIFPQKVNGIIELYKKGVRIPINFYKISNIRENVAHWTEAYHIHNWLIKNACEYPHRNITEFRVEREKVVELLDICKEIKANPKLAKKLLPTEEKYDDWYYDSIDYTINVFEETLIDTDDDTYYWYYCWD